MNTKPKNNIRFSVIILTIIAVLLLFYALYLIIFGLGIGLISQVTLDTTMTTLIAGFFLFLKGITFLIVSIGLFKRRKWAVYWFLVAITLGLSAFFIDLNNWENFDKEVLLIVYEATLFGFCFYNRKGLAN